MAFGKALMETRILASGSTQKLKVMECTSSPMVINMKENGSNVSERATALTFSPMETVMSASTARVSPMASDSTSGKMAAATLDNSITV